ncbi:MAG: hypothetical protein MK212_09920 [Saprospiraceae bacterium]|nr:hypothetical protein [Saprospiraceae bacterium]
MTTIRKVAFGLFILFLTSLNNNLLAQAPTKNAKLITEIETFYDLRFTMYTKKNKFIASKWIHDPAKSNAVSFVSIYHTIIDNLPEMAVFADKELSKKLSPDEIQEILANSDNKREGAKPGPMNGNDIDVMKVIHELYYDAEKIMFYPIPKAIGFFKSNWSGTTQANSYGKALFWLDIETSIDPVDISKQNITWAVNSRKSLRMFNLESSKLDENYTKYCAQFIDALRSNADKVAIFSINPLSYRPVDDPITIDKTKEIWLGEETEITMDPETFDEIISVKVIKEEERYRALEYLSTIELWYWDDAKKKMGMQLSGIAPEQSMYDSNQIFLSRFPLFFRFINNLDR